MKKLMTLIAIFVLSNALPGGLTAPAFSQAHEREYTYSGRWYPLYRPFSHRHRHNPVVEREYYGSRGYDYDGTYHRESTVVDKHSSYYSPGRNEAITRPRTTVKTWRDDAGVTTKEKTSWIGADGRPHSTTITRDTTVDRWGNTSTDTHVSLRKAK